MVVGIRDIAPDNGKGVGGAAFIDNLESALVALNSRFYDSWLNHGLDDFGGQLEAQLLRQGREVYFP